MAFNGSGTFNRTNGTNTGSTLWASDRDEGTAITATRHDTHDQDLADGLSNCICTDGQSSISADIPWGGYSITGLAGIKSATNDNITVEGVNGNDVVLSTSGSFGWRLENDGTFRPQNNTYDIGDATYTVSTIYVAEVQTPLIAPADATQLQIRTSTSDGSDTQSVILGGGGDFSATRGAQIKLHGADVSAGDLVLSSSDTSGSDIKNRVYSTDGYFSIATNNITNEWRFQADGDLEPQGSGFDIATSGTPCANIYGTTLYAGSSTIAEDGSGHMELTSASSKDILFSPAGSNSYFITWNGGHLRVSANNTYDIGTSAARIRQIYSNNTVDTSDARIKTNVDTIDASVAAKKIAQIRPVDYNFTEEYGESERRRSGFIAQELHKVLPTCVLPGDDTSEYVANESELWSVQDAFITPYLVAALQDVLTRLAKLEEQNEN